MSNDLVEELGRNIPLSEMIASLRQELRVALTSGDDDVIRFEVTKIELELQVAICKEHAGSGGLTFGVLTAGASKKNQTQDTHTFRLELKPEFTKGASTAQPLKLTSEPHSPLRQPT